MKKFYTRPFFGLLLMITISAHTQDSLFISEVTDPADDYSGRFIELYNPGGETVDFGTSAFYLSRQSNGGTSWGDLQLTGSVAPGETFVIGGSAFEALYGFAPDQETGILIGNGDDAYFLFRDGDHIAGSMHDIYGAVDTDGTGEPWEYEDSRAVRLPGVATPNVTWTAAEWEILPAGIADCSPGTHVVSPGGDTVPAPGNHTIYIVNDTVDQGQPVEVPVSVSLLTAADQIISYQFDVGFDSTVLEFTGATVSGTLAEGGTVMVNPAVAGSISVGYMTSIPVTGEGPILILHFSTLGIDTTDLIISDAYLNNVPVDNLNDGTVIITETSPPTAYITYTNTSVRYADTVLITANFSEPMAEANPVMLHLGGAVTLADSEMTRLNDTVYVYFYPVPKAEGEVYVGLSNGTDLRGNEVVSVPTSGGTFNIIRFLPGDVNDDGIIMAYDAALTLQYSVGIDPLPEIDPRPWEYWRDSTANVDGTPGITAHDAGMILQYSVGMIPSLSPATKGSFSAAGVSAEIDGNHIVFRSHGALLGLNLRTTNENQLLGSPVVLAENFLSAFNTGGADYQVGLCTHAVPPEGSAILKIPFTGRGKVSFHMFVNSVEAVVTVDLPTVISDPEDERILVYPNPASDWLTIRGINAPALARICSMDGRPVRTARLEDPVAELEVSGLPAGLYILKIESGRGAWTKKILLN